MGRTICVGDQHNSHRALVQCLERSNFDKKEDTLISLGDILDSSWPDAYECVEELISIPKLIAITGNHDVFFTEWLTHGLNPDRWLQGGYTTLASYCKHLDKQYWGKYSGYITSMIPEDIPQSHRDFFLKTQKLYHIDHKNRFFVHGGFDRTQFVDYLAITNPSDFYWNRGLWNQARSCTGTQKLKTANEFSEIYIGHTTVESFSNVPVTIGGVTNMDTGAGFGGCLSFQDVETKEIWQSDLCTDLYPEISHKRR